MKNLNQIIGFVIMVILIASCNKENPKESQKKTPNKITTMQNNEAKKPSCSYEFDLILV